MLDSKQPPPCLNPSAAVPRSAFDWLVHSENGVPVQIEDRHVIADFAPACLEQDFQKVTPSAYLTAISPLQEAEQVVRAAQPNAAVRGRLQMEESEPSLVVLRRTWSRGRPVTFARLHHPGSRQDPDLRPDRAGIH